MHWTPLTLCYCSSNYLLLRTLISLLQSPSTQPQFCFKSLLCRSLLHVPRYFVVFTSSIFSTHFLFLCYVTCTISSFERQHLIFFQLICICHFSSTSSSILRFLSTSSSFFATSIRSLGKSEAVVLLLLSVSLPGPNKLLPQSIASSLLCPCTIYSEGSTGTRKRWTGAHAHCLQLGTSCSCGHGACILYIVIPWQCDVICVYTSLQNCCSK